VWVITADAPDAKEQQDMKKWKRYWSFRRLVVAFAAMAVAVPVAQAQAQVTQQDPGFTPATAQAAKRIYGIPADAYRRLPADDQEALRPPSYAASVRVGGSSPSTTAKTAIVNTSTPAVYDTSSTFSWGSAGIWAASGLVLMSFAAFGALLVVRSRSRMGQPAV
jgi:hypothetical protein